MKKVILSIFIICLLSSCDDSEEVTETIFISEAVTACNVPFTTFCKKMSTEAEGDYTSSSDSINNFDYQFGYNYELLVTKHKYDDSIQDVGEYYYVLVQEEQKYAQSNGHIISVDMHNLLTFDNTPEDYNEVMGWADAELVMPTDMIIDCAQTPNLCQSLFINTLDGNYSKVEFINDGDSEQPNYLLHNILCSAPEQDYYEICF